MVPICFASLDFSTAGNMLAPLFNAIKTVAVGVLFFIVGSIIFLILFGVVVRLVSRFRKKV